MKLDKSSDWNPRLGRGCGRLSGSMERGHRLGLWKGDSEDLALWGGKLRDPAKEGDRLMLIRG